MILLFGCVASPAIEIHCYRTCLRPRQWTNARANQDICTNIERCGGVKRTRIWRGRAQETTGYHHPLVLMCKVKEAIFLVVTRNRVYQEALTFRNLGCILAHAFKTSFRFVPCAAQTKFFVRMIL